MVGLYVPVEEEYKREGGPENYHQVLAVKMYNKSML
jgi:hypothetical protein